MKATYPAILIACAAAFVVTAAIGPSIIKYLQKMKFGQKILEIGPIWHMKKQYTPTMGGFMFIIGIWCALVLAALIGGVPLGGLDLAGYLAVPLLATAYAMVGFLDDYTKIKKKQNAGLTARQKLVLQILVAGLFIALLRLSGQSGAYCSLYIPFVRITLHDIPWTVYILFAAFVIVGCDNAVNLTDGIDGLAAGVTLPVAVFFALYGMKNGYSAAAICAGALAGALAAFLIYNFNPAKVFMGDTGSLFLGGMVAGLAFACEQPLLLIPVGAVYIWETLSVIIQVAYFRATGGKRFFKMAPFHHHLEQCGWGEKKIVLVSAGLTTLLCALCYFWA